MTRSAIVCVCAFLACIGLALTAGCTRLPPLDPASLKVETSAELQEQLRSHEPDLEVFRSRGPFAVTAHENRELRLSDKERIRTDLFLSALGDPAPLVIFVHGHESTKAAHAKQAMHLSSWGMHALTVQLPTKGPWDMNGAMLARIVSLIGRSPEVIDSRIDAKRIILVGYSFGASAVAVALARGVPAVGAVLLDPAAIGKDLPELLWRIDKPIMVIGADDEVYAPRDREYFFDYVRGSIAEVSVRGAVHEDAQYPSDAALQNAGHDPNATEEFQITFVAALTAAAISLSATGALDYAWTSFGPAFEDGRFFNAKKK